MFYVNILIFILYKWFWLRFKFTDRAEYLVFINLEWQKFLNLKLLETQWNCIKALWRTHLNRINNRMITRAENKTKSLLNENTFSRRDYSYILHFRLIFFRISWPNIKTIHKNFYEVVETELLLQVTKSIFLNTCISFSLLSVQCFSHVWTLQPCFAVHSRFYPVVSLHMMKRMVGDKTVLCCFLHTKGQN